MWNNEDKTVKLYVKQDTCCAGDVTLGFSLKNPEAAQAAQIVSLSAGPIGTSGGQLIAGYLTSSQEFDVDDDQAIKPVSDLLSHPKSPLYTKSIAISKSFA
jgi:hypothetical protein